MVCGAGVGTRVGIQVGYQGGYTRVGIQEGYTGYYPATAGSHPDSEAGPVGPCKGPEWVVRVAGVLRRRDGSQTHPAGPVSHPVASLVWDPQNAASWPIGRDSATFLRNLVKTAECHLKMSKRPVIVPVYKTASESHLLIFSDFRFCEPSLTRN